MATTGMPEPFTSATTVSRSPLSGAFRPVPNMASTIRSHSRDLGDVQFPRLLSAISTTVGRAGRDVEVDARIAADVGDAADHEHRHVDAALQQRPRHDEPVAAVVPASAQHRDVVLLQIAVRWLPSQPPPGGPAFSISTSDGIPISSIVRRSASRICAALSTLMRVARRIAQAVRWPS